MDISPHLYRLSRSFNPLSFQDKLFYFLEKAALVDLFFVALYPFSSSDMTEQAREKKEESFSWPSLTA